ncbi:MAG: hypothetical protein AAF802_14535 [Planctomycetota bacterium]
MNETHGLKVPESLKQQLLAFRSRVRRIKLVEAVAMTVFIAAMTYLAVFLLDRVTDTPSAIRGVLAIAGIGAVVLIPLAVIRWVLRYRTPQSVSRLLAKKMPSIGDQLLGVIELAASRTEQARSLALCQAAMKQVAGDASKCDFNQATPSHRYRTWSTCAVAGVLVVLTLAFVFPAASSNAFARWATPWKVIPRYTFTQLTPIESDWIIAHGEPAKLSFQLRETSLWKPETATLKIGTQAPITTTRVGDRFEFEVPPQISDQSMDVVVGDFAGSSLLKPTLRPELAGVMANVRLPDYLGIEEPEARDSRAGRITLVKGSRAVIEATANRPLESGRINDQPHQPNEATLVSNEVEVSEASMVRFEWKDQLGLSGREPFEMTLEAIDDEAPTLIVDGLSRQAVVLDSETLTFTITSNDDFGVKKVGLMWRGLDSRLVEGLAQGERTLAAGGSTSRQLDAKGTFSAKALGIDAQPIELFAWSEDYLPGRERVYSAPHVLFILTPDQHAIWMAEQLSRWHRKALDVRDRERQLYEENKRLRDLPRDSLASPDNRRAVERQASAERSNGRRLDRLGELGDELIAAASKNPEIGVGHLERWAEMLQVLRDLSENRMPSVADLLDEAATSKPKMALDKNSKPSTTTSPQPKQKNSPSAGMIRTASGGEANEIDPDSPKLRDAPQLADMESSANSPDDNELEPGPPKKPNSPALRIPVTTVMGKATKKKQQPPANQQDQMEAAVTEQEDLLAEFDRLAEELNEVLANLEGSTLVKRLKAASRVQNLIAGKLTGQLESSFGQVKLEDNVKEVLGELEDTERKTGQKVSYIMDDMAAYFERRRFARFKTTLDEMKEANTLDSLRQLASKLNLKQGTSIAEAEFWADSFDRWAENLVDPACNGSCPGGKSPESLPPSIVLEVLQILEAEIALREETRVAEQAKSAVEAEEHLETADSLSNTQNEINQRVVKVIERINALPDSSKHFAKELKMLHQVDLVMAEATEILSRPDTGAPAIAAETEAIELILRSKRINPNGGGGGGSSPGGGGGGNTVDSALALVGKGRNEKEVRQEKKVSQTTGETGTPYPEEFRSGLDQYFNRLSEQ